MTDQRMEMAALHARTSIFKMRLEASRKIIAKAGAMFQNWYVAFSSGKDSTVVFHLVKEQIPNVAMLYGDDEWLLPESEEYLERVKEKYGTQLHRARFASKHTSWFRAWLDDKTAFRGRNAIAVKNQLMGWDGVFLGLRAEESSKRETHLHLRGPIFYSGHIRCWECNPIHHWTSKDVWAFIVSRDLDYNRAYDKMEALGVPVDRQRIGPLAVERVLQFGQLALLKRGWPDLYNKFCERYPMARLYS